ncbi:translation factor, SUA5 domain [Mycoplasmopsis bovigenitalium]|uniref:L-threonylcarbamoyladenylate synthase n=1 Tax=Mycoplasmopsis bovigenitalium TaxID=2112 RepID=A0A449A9N6_9BACT|nr:Sua5/YciO/YrdC/YwlC family protein [Mycoplasmopsis bovigenitalium]VEU60906.1 translation factor, SUA5 domain [Mycoplasmopsis bovigenitalium]
MKYNNLFISSTDTVCGIAGPICEQTLEQIYTLKKRGKTKKIIILVGSLEQARQFSQWNNEAEEFAKKYWPGAYSLIVNNQGFRMPNQPKLLEYLLKNGPVYMTSANISGQVPIELKQAQDVFPQIKNIYDFGPSSGQPSKIYNLDTKTWIR